ncbi:MULTISPECIES: hypothetical protein [unclassified Pseudomonas]|uniref:hypothetical protein n=1 Tax=unclassified Pseudomonas TaxID=196821 RepID=UPI0030D76A20
MTFTVWGAVLGAVLLTLALTSVYLRWMPVTTSGGSRATAFSQCSPPAWGCARSGSNPPMSVVALSILVHGVTTQPTLAWYERHKHSG